MGKKYYAVKIGRKTGVFSTWNECEEQIKGVSGAVYKGFKTLDEAEIFLKEAEEVGTMPEEAEVNIEELNNQIEDAIKTLKEDECIAFVDGSYSVKDEKAGYGAIIFDGLKEKSTLYKAFSSKYKPDFVELRNVSAELEAVKDSISLAIEKKMNKISIYYDYIGIGEWAKGNWKAKKDITKEYVQFINETSKLITIDFLKVPAHKGVFYNEEADKLAKRSLLSRGHRTYLDGSVYFIKYQVDDWIEIIGLIVEENDSLDENISEIQYEIKDLGKYKQIQVYSNTQRVYINCYPTGAYVQGKHTSLYQKIVSTAVECLTNDEEVVEILDNYYAIDIPKDEVTRKFDRKVSNFQGSRDTKIYNNILTAVYNTMLSTYMPDYTQLLTPIFRAYEFCLHRIVGERLGLTTYDAKGKNNFSYFGKNDEGRFYFNHSNKSVLNEEQLSILEEIYNQYHSVRHKYSHWSYDEIETAVIETIEEAREMLDVGLTNVDKYYMMFY